MMAQPTSKPNIVTAIVYDFETGGLDCTKSAATQISMHAVRLDTFEVMETYSAYIYPYNRKDNILKPARRVLKKKYDDEEEELMDYSEGALSYSAITMEMLYKNGKPLEDVCNEICDFIERNTLPVTLTNKPFMVGQNPLFDKGFMQQIMVYSGMWPRFIKLVRGSVDFWGNFQPAQLDTILLAQLAMNHDRGIITYKLESIASQLGIDLDDAHDADADVVATREVMRVLTARMRNQNGDIEDCGMTSMEKPKKDREHFKI